MEREYENKILNYRITIQKLEEELSLYRNGTTNQQLVEFIAEKDKEIGDLKGKLSESSENYRKLAKSSRDVLIRLDALSHEHSLKLDVNSILEDKLKIAESQLDDLSLSISRLQSDKSRLEDHNGELKTRLTHLENELTERNDNIDKLQQRCAALVSEKSEKSKLLEKEKSERIKQTKELRDELSRTTRLNTDLNHQLAQAQSESRELSEKVRDGQVALSDIRRTNANLLRDLDVRREAIDDQRRQHSQAMDALAAELADSKQRLHTQMSKGESLAESLRSRQQEASIALALRDAKLVESARMVSELQGELRQQQQRHSSDMRDNEERRKGELNRLHESYTALQQRLQRVEEERDGNLIRKREHDLSQAKIAELENRIKSQDLFFKKRLLGDRGVGVGGMAAQDAENRVNGRTSSPSVRMASPVAGKSLGPPPPPPLRASSAQRR